MGFWPFGGSKKNTADDKSKDTLLEKTNQPTMAHQQREAKLREARLRKASEKPSGRGNQVKTEPKKLAKTRTDMPQAAQPRNIPRSQTTPLNRSFDGENEKARESSSDLRRPPRMYQHIPTSQSSIGPDNFSAVSHAPTLHAKRSDFNPSMPRRKSSKRKAEDYAREREVRAMSSPMPIPKPKRPATYSGSGPLTRDTRNIPGSLNKNLSRPTSQVSLPYSENISELDEPAHQNAFKIGIFSALSPRPTVRYDANSRLGAGKQPVRHRPVDDPIEEEDDVSFSKQRINDLADGLDSRALHDLMERDQKRRERKKDSDRKKLERRLQKRAERQKEEETRNERAQAFVSQSQADLRARSAAGSIQNDGAPGPAVEQRQGIPGHMATTTSREDPFADTEMTHPVQQGIRNPFDDEQEADIMQLPSPEEETEPPIPVRSALRTAGQVQQETEPKPFVAALQSPPSSPVGRPIEQPSVSQMSGPADETVPVVSEATDRSRQASEQSSTQPSSWTNFFKRGVRQKSNAGERFQGTPSEFSNTSRESSARKAPQGPPVFRNDAARTFRKSQTSIPQRTMSKFREDLPELPLSPPDSRVQSPEATIVQPGAGSSLSSKQQPQSLMGTLDTRSLATSSSIPTLDKGRPDSRLQSLQTGDAEAGTPENAGHALSQSLASVDSEGSWLSGRPTHRFSRPTSGALRQSESSLSRQVPGAFEADDDGLVDDEYLRRLSPNPDDRRSSMLSSGRRASSTLIDLQKEQEQEQEQSGAPQSLLKGLDKDEKLHEGIARQPTVVRAATRAKSSEGLLKSYTAEDDKTGSSDDDGEDFSPVATPGEEVQLMRAQSIEYKGHARQISAGSARLLDIRRSSGQLETPPRSPALPKKRDSVVEHQGEQ